MQGCWPPASLKRSLWSSRVPLPMWSPSFTSQGSARRRARTSTGAGANAAASAVGAVREGRGCKCRGELGGRGEKARKEVFLGPALVLLDGSAQRGHFIELHETVEFIVAVGLPDFDVKIGRASCRK